MISADFIIALPIGAIIGWIIREVVSDKLARDRAFEMVRITEFNKAAAIFHAAFIDIIYLLRQNSQTAEIHYSNILTDKILITHEKARIMFEPYLIPDKLAGFNTAWEKYKDSEENYYKEFLQEQRPEPTIEDVKARRKDFSQYCLTHLYALLEYAKPKI
jgi:hypothetical protein